MRVEGGLGEEHGVLVLDDVELSVGVRPEVLHVLPVADDAVADRVVQFQDAFPTRGEGREGWGEAGKG